MTFVRATNNRLKNNDASTVASVERYQPRTKLVRADASDEIHGEKKEFQEGTDHEL